MSYQIQNRPSKKYIISSIDRLVGLLIDKPVLLQIPSFAVFRPIVEQIQNSTGCSKCRINDMFKKYQHQFQAAVNNLNGENIKTLKSILNVDEICYYSKKTNGILERICI